MNFNIDDPLADLLSDNSLDNDFFDVPNIGRSSTAKSSKPSKPKGKVEDLFGIQEETEAEVKDTQKQAAAKTPRIVKQKPSTSQDEAADDSDDLGFDPKQPKGGAKKSLLEFINNVETKRPATASAKPSMSRQSTDTTTENSNLPPTQTRPKTSSGRRSSTQSTVVNTDILGLFSRDKDTNVTASGMSTPLSKTRAPTADWLGLELDTPAIAQPVRPVSPTMLQHEQPATSSHADTSDVIQLADAEEQAAYQAQLKPVDEYYASATELPAKPHLTEDTTANNILLLNSLNLESNNALTVLQQQESQLALTTQIKRQERALLEMQHRQESMLQQQDRQFHTLIEQQLQRQQRMEENIKMQQQRINTHIKLMMNQIPFVAPPLNSVADDEDRQPLPASEVASASAEAAKHTDAVTESLLQAESDVKRLELEKLRLEELTANIRVNAEQELQLIENSYKNQLKVLESHQAAVEERLKTENGDLKQYYERKLVALEQELQKLKEGYESDIEVLKQDNEDKLRRLRKSHQDDIEMLKEEHRGMLDAIRQSKLLEFAAVQENGNYLETLRLASTNLETLSGDLQELRDNMQNKAEVLHLEREKKLTARERRLEDAERRLTIGEEAAEEEKRRLMELVGTLEAQLNRVSKDTAEENWLLRQRMSSLEGEKQAFEREKEYHREQMTQDEKRIADLKTQNLADTQRIMAELKGERDKIFVERAKIEMERKLHLHSDLDKDRLEVEAQLQLTHEAIRRADEERERYYKLQRDTEQRQRQLIEKQNELNAKEDELAQETSAYRMAESRSQVTEEQLRQSEQLLRKKLHMLNQRMRELSQKEEKLSEDRMLLTQERIAVRNLKLQIGKSKCSLCRMSVENAELAQMMRQNETNSLRKHTTAFEGISKPDEPENFGMQPLGSRHDIVDRMLDDHIAVSLRRMHGMSADYDNWRGSVLDDDSKKLALDNSNRENMEDDAI